CTFLCSLHVTFSCLHSFPTRRSSDLDAARELFARFRINNLKGFIVEHKLLDIGQRDVGAGLGVVQPAVRVFLDETYNRCGLGLRSEEHTSELQSRENLVCRLLLEKKK